MTAVETPSLLRWSSVRDCPRKSVYEAVDAPARERYDREERILFRGRRLGRDYADMLAAKYGETNIERERKVVWPLGVGHMDVFLPETRTAVEILSSAHASETYTRSKLLQLVGYVEHDPDAENGVLVILNPSDYSGERVVIVPSSRLYQELVEEMHARIAEVVAWRDSGEVPGRVCSKPGDARGHFCLYAEHCFEGWTAPPLEELAADETLVAAVAEFAEVKRLEQQIGGDVKALEKRRKDAQAVIEAADLPAGDVQIGGYKVTRTPVARKATFDWDKAEAAGRFAPDAFPEFFKPGASYSTFKAEKVAAEDWGDEAPWTDADLDG